MLARASVSVSLLLSLLLSACGAARTGPRVSSPFTEDHAAVFDDGVDYIARTDTLDGAWLDQFESEVQGRVSYADLIVVGKVETLRQATDLDRRTAYHIVIRIERALHGSPERRTLTLTVREGDRAFATVDGKERELLEHNFIAYVKWYEREDGEIAAHWHLSPASPPIVARTEELVAARQVSSGQRRGPRVIEHRN